MTLDSVVLLPLRLICGRREVQWPPPDGLPFSLSFFPSIPVFLPFFPPIPLSPSRHKSFF